MRGREPRKLQVLFESLPPSELYPNSAKRLHWAVKNRVTQAARFEARMAVQGAWEGLPVFQQAIVEYEFHAKTKQVRDIEALVAACKPWLDGIVDGGVLLSDGGWHLSIGGAILLLDPEEKTLITVWEVIP